MKPHETNNASAKPKKLKWYDYMNKLITQHSYFDKKTQQVGGSCSNYPIYWMGAPKIYTSYYIHTL